MRKLRRLAIIPARSGSKRIKNKNIKKFFSKPIIFYSINNAINSKIFDKIHVSTNCKKISKIAENYGCRVDFLRPQSKSRDNVPLIEVLKFVVEEYNKKKEFFDEIWLIYPCAPLTTKNDLIKAKKKFSLTKKDYPLMSFREYDAPIEWAFKQKGKKFIANSVNKLTIDSKKITKNYYDSASFVIYKNNHIFKEKTFSKYYSYIMPKNRSIDIDDNQDWKIAEALFKKVKY
jgi:pseudaminic acid cytidylyltransferase